MAIKNLELTTAEKLMVQEWRRYQDEHGHPPSQRHLASLLGVFPNSVVHMIKMLRVKGYLREERITKMRLTLSAKAKKIP